MKEIWKKIKALENYSVSSEGQVRNDKTERIFKLGKDKKGYIRITIQGKVFRVHRLVAENFIENDEGKKEINHINGIKSDNRLENLEWVTSSENRKHALINGLASGLKGSSNPSVKLTELQVLKILNLSEKGILQNELASKFNCHQTTISKILSGTIWSELTGIKKEKEKYGKC